MTKRKSTTSENANFEEYIKSVDQDLANLEKIGSAFLVFGYANYIRSAQIDILEINDINNTGLNPDEVIVMAQKFVLLGYALLLVISFQRLNQKALENSILDENTNLAPYELIKFSYLISVYANLLRLIGFLQIEAVNNGGVVIE